MRPFRLPIAIPLALAAALAPIDAGAHEFSLESLGTAFVRIEPAEAHLVVRLPLHVLRPSSFPARGREIDLDRAAPAIARALAEIGRDVVLQEDGRTLAPISSRGRLSLPSDRSFEHYADAVAHVSAPLAPGTVIYFDQGFFDAHFVYAIASPRSRFALRTAVAPELKDHLKLAVRYLPLDEPERAMVVTSRSGLVALNPSWYRAAAAFAVLGIEHIATGLDHLLFLLCLVIPIRGFVGLAKLVSAFTVGHSITLGAAAAGWAPAGAWFSPFVETAIALSIVCMAVANILSRVTHRAAIAALFGLVHGFGFAHGLQESLQFAGRHLVVSLFAFNAGIEIGQVLALALLIPLLSLLLRFALPGPIGAIVLSAMIAHVGWHWMVERGEVLWKVDWPEPNIALTARWLAALFLAGALARTVARRWPRPASALAVNAPANPSIGPESVPSPEQAAGGARLASSAAVREPNLGARS